MRSQKKCSSTTDLYAFDVSVSGGHVNGSVRHVVAYVNADVITRHLVTKPLKHVFPVVLSCNVGDWPPM